MIKHTNLRIIFLPPLLQMLVFHEKAKGAALTKEEVLNIRDNAVCMTISEERYKKMIEHGHQDIDPNNCWQEWCAYKQALIA